MSDAIDRAAEVLNLAGAHCGECGREPGEALSECRACEMHITDCAAYLADAGLLAPAPLREEWAAAWEGHGATRIGFAQESPEDIEGVPPGGWVVRRHVSDWLSVDRAEGDGRAGMLFPEQEEEER